MKLTRNITVDSDIASEIIKIKNVSSLINNLLRQHFKLKEMDNLSIEQLKTEIEKEEKKIQLRKELEELEHV